MLLSSLLLLLALITAACGTSQPEPALTPIPTPDAILAENAGQVTELDRLGRGSLTDVDALLETVNAIVAEVPYLERRSISGWPPGSVGDVSARIGYEVRDLWMAGYDAARIESIVCGQRTVEDLLTCKPRSRPVISRKPGGRCPEDR